MAQHPLRIDRLPSSDDTYLIVQEGQPEPYSCPVGYLYHAAGRWSVRVNGQQPGATNTPPIKSWEDALAFADGHLADLTPPPPHTIVEWARLAYPATVAHQSTPSERLKHFRSRYHLSQVQLAAGLHVSRRNVEDWESEKVATVPPPYLIDLALPSLARRIMEARP